MAESSTKVAHAVEMGSVSGSHVSGIDWAAHDFHHVVELPDDYVVLDFSETVPVTVFTDRKYTIGRYDELRPNVYNTPLFEGVRNIHMGIDIGGPVGTEVCAFADGTIHSFGYNEAAGDYGHVVITQHTLDGVDLWALFGHLDSGSTAGKEAGQQVSAGEVIGRFGRFTENGGWPPHVHIQLSYVEPDTHDMPGVVSKDDHAQALERFPDPQLVLGTLY